MTSLGSATTLRRASLTTFRWERVLRRDSLDLISRIVTGGLAVVCVILIALTAKVLIETHLSSATLVNKLQSISPSIKLENDPAFPVSDSASDISVIASRSVFGALQTSTPSATPPPTALRDPLSLIGTYVTEGEPSYAIIEDDKRKTQDVFGIGEPIFGEGQVKRIFVDKVEIERGGQLETLLLDIDSPGTDDSGPSSSSGGDLVVVQENEYTQALENLPLLLTQARAVPYFKDGKAQGLRLFAVKSGSFYERLGLKNGDVLKSINGNSLADLSQAMQLLDKLKTERSFSMSVDRNSEPRELRYEIR